MTLKALTLRLRCSRCGKKAAQSGTSSSETRRNKAGIQGGEQAEWPRLVRAMAIVDQCLTCKARLAYHLSK